MRPINNVIDHTLLKTNATAGDIDKLCTEALQFQFCAVCIQPYWIPHVHQRLRGSAVLVCTVTGFPQGANTSESKIHEAMSSLESGADEVDVVMNIGAFLSGRYEAVARELREIKTASLVLKPNSAVKVIIETCYLTPDQISQAVEICGASKVDFVKTSTGFGPRGASLDDIRAIKETMQRRPECSYLKIKASGGIRTLADARAYLEAGADRIGTSNGVGMMT